LEKNTIPIEEEPIDIEEIIHKIERKEKRKQN
jgi:hypothetical protein